MALVEVAVVPCTQGNHMSGGEVPLVLGSSLFVLYQQTQDPTQSSPSLETHVMQFCDK